MQIDNLQFLQSIQTIANLKVFKESYFLHFEGAN